MKKNFITEFIFKNLMPEADFLYINGPETLPPPLSAEEEEETLSRLAEGSCDARDCLIERNLRLVVYIARKFENTGVNIEDLISIGTIGLIKAVESFSADKNIKLATYASRCIENEILMYLRKTTQSKGDISIDEPLNVDWDGNELLLSDILGTDDSTVFKNVEDEAESDILRKAVSKLGKREKEITELRFGLRGGNEMTQNEVAAYLGISQSYISRLEKKILRRLRDELSGII